MSQSDSDPVRPVGHPDLNALIMAVGRGEPGAFDTLFRRLYRSVYRTALAVIRDPAQAEEVAQEVFMEVWRAAGQFDRPRARHKPGS